MGEIDITSNLDNINLSLMTASATPCRVLGFRKTRNAGKLRKEVMKRWIMMIAATVLLCSSVSFAETNGQQQANNDIVKNTSTVAVTTIVGRIASIAGPKPTAPRMQMSENGSFQFSSNAKDLGLSSGDGSSTIGVWGLGTYSNFESRASGGKYDADAYNAFIGVDWRATPELLIGLAGGWGDLDLDKKDWGGNGSIKTDSQWTIMPYAAYNITDTTILDAAFGYTTSRYKDSNNTTSAKYDSTSMTTSIGISQYYMVNDWTLSARLGYMYSDGEMDSYTLGGVYNPNPDVYLGQLSLKGKAAYAFSNGLEPYVGMEYRYDTQTSAIPVESDYDEFEGTLGLNWYVGNAWTLNVEGGTTLGREKYEAYRGQFNVRYEF